MVQRLVLVYAGPQQHVWMLLLRGGAFSSSYITHKAVRVSRPHARVLTLPLRLLQLRCSTSRPQQQ